MGIRRKHRDKSRWLLYGQMIISYFFRWCERYKVRAEGVKCERLITDIYLSKITLENVVMLDESTVVFWCSGREFSMIEEIAQDKYLLKTVEQVGVIPKVRNIVKGRGIVVGIVMVMFMLIAQQFVVMEVEVKGNAGVAESDLRRVVAEAGLKEYSLKTGYEEERVKAAIFDNFNDITWVNIAEKGSYALVEVVEGSKIKKPENTGVLHDIVAAKEGYIEEIIVKNGYKNISEGDFVQAGQVLIKSEIPINNTTYDESRDGTFRYVDAEGIVKAKVIYKLSFETEAGIYSEEQLKQKLEAKSREYLRENVPEMLEIRNIGLKFYSEKNIIKGVITLEVIEIISTQKENEFAEKFHWDNRQYNDDGG